MTPPVKRALTPALNPTGIGAAAAALYAAVMMIWNASNHHGVIDPQVLIAAAAAAAFLYSRFKVTPVADPRDGNGQPLAPAPAQPALPLPAGGYTPAAGLSEPAVPPPGPAGTSPPAGAGM